MEQQGAIDFKQAVLDRFWSNVRKTNRCWLWAGKKDNDGYGIFSYMHGSNRAARISWMIHNGIFVPSGYFVIHSCDVKACVRPEHLRIGTAKENTRDMLDRGRHWAFVGADAPRARLTEKQVTAILADPRAYAQIAADHNVATTTIASIKQRVSWRYLNLEVVKGSHRGQKGELRYNARLTEADVRAIRASTETGKALAERYGVTPMTICDIRKRRSWKHIN